MSNATVHPLYLRRSAVQSVGILFSTEVTVLGIK